MTTFSVTRSALRASILVLLCSAMVWPVRAQLFISEFMASNGRTLADEDGDYSDWIEIHNAGDTPVDLTGWYLTDSANRLTQWQFPATNVTAGGFLVVFASGKDRRTPGAPLHTNFKLGDGGEYLALVEPDGVTVAHAYAPQYPQQVRDVSFGLGQSSRQVDLVTADTPVRWLVPSDGMLGLDWVDPAFDDTGWQAGTNALGFDLTPAHPFASRISTDVGAAMHGQNGSLYMRVPFIVDDPTSLQGLELSAQYNDGFVLYLNGVEIFTRNAPHFAPGGIVADSVAEFSGVQGQDDWFYGYYNRSADNDGRYDPDDFTPFPSSGTSYGPDNYWTGSAWDWWQGNAPWTMIGATECHPNGLNNPPEHWVIRRWRSDVEGTLIAHIHLAKQNPNCGNGVTGQIYHNGRLVYSRVIAASDTTGVDADVTIPDVRVADYIDFVVTPAGTDGDPTDPCDGTIYTATIEQQSGPSLEWNAVATVSRSVSESLATERIDLSGAKSLMLLGTNLLAVHALNSGVNDSNFLMRLSITANVATRMDENLARYFTVPSPGEPNGGGTADLGPVILDPDHFPRVPSPGEDLTVTARITPAFAPIRTNLLHYRLMFLPEATVPMLDDGQHGDGEAGDGIYGAVIPASAAREGEMIRWYITSTDTENRTSRWPLFLDPLNSSEYLGTMVHVPQTNKLEILHLFIQNPSAADTDTGTRCSLFYLGEFYDNLVINRHGQSSRGFPKKSYDIDFNPDHNFLYSPGEARVDDINLMTTYPDKAHMRNILAYETYRDADNPYHFTYPVRVQMNGSFWGDAHLMENGDDNWLKRLGLDPRGALYKMYNRFDQLSDTTIGVNGSAAEKKTRKNEGNQDLRELFQGVVQQSGEARRRYIYDNIDVPEMINYLAARIITGDRDCCHKNYYFYRDTEGTGEWMAMAWDVDLSFGRNWNSSDTYWDETLHPDNGLFVGQNNGLFNALFNTPEIRQMYLRRIRTLMEELLQPPGTPPEQLKYEKRIDELAGVIGPDAELDFQKWPHWGNGSAISTCCIQTLTQAVEILKTQYLPQRRDWMFQRRISGGNEIPDSQPTNTVIQFATIEYNPASHNQDEEYIELQNPNNYAVDISGWQISGAVRYTFRGGVVIPANSTLYVSPNVVAFRNRTVSPKGGESRFVQGPYQGHLSARGETLLLTDKTGRVVDTKTYAGNPSPAQQYLRITEIMYHPAPAPAGSTNSAEDFEFIELKNTGPQAIDLTGVRFVDGISFDFTGSSVTNLAPGETVLLVRNVAAFESRYGAGHHIAGTYADFLDNGGERLRLLDADNEEILDFSYRDGWYPVTDGLGFSLVITNEATAFDLWDQKASWRPSAAPGGSPGQTDPEPTMVSEVWINEVLSHTEAPGLLDAVELYNPGSTAVDISGWYLTDDFNNPRKYRIPDGTVIPPGGFLVFDERHFNPTPGVPPSFAFNAKGDQAYLFAARPDGTLTGYFHGYSFGAAAADVSFGRYTNSLGEEFFVPMSQVTLGAPNAAPLVGPLAISQIMYHPQDFGYFETYDNSIEEYIELRNITTNDVALFDAQHPTNTWRLRGGVDLEFPPGVVVPAGGRVVLVNVDPRYQPRDYQNLLTRFGFSDGTPVFGPYRGKLDNSRDTIRILRPDTPDGDQVPYVLVDEVEYRDDLPWPPNADGTGLALQRIDLQGFGTEPTNWTAVPVLRPNILEHPADALVLAGASVTFKVRVEHPEVVTYQWFYEDAPIPGATNDTLTIPDAQMENQGLYSVEVANAVGPVRSRPARLAILVRPEIVEHPQDLTVLEGETAVFTVRITGNPPPFGYRWRRSGATITNEVSDQLFSTFVIPEVRLADAGVYTVVVTNAAFVRPGVLSGRALLTVLADADRDHMADDWERQFGLDPSNAQDALLDSDGDGHTNAQEYKAGTDPTDPSSVLRVERIELSGQVRLQFTAMSNHTYTVQMKSALEDSEWLKLTDVPAAPTNRTVTITDPDATGNRFYRLRTPQQR